MKIAHRVAGVLAAALLPVAAVQAQAIDEAAAQSLMKKSNCFKCHSVSAKKDAPSYQEIAAKYKGKPDGEKKILEAITTNPKVKVDGQEEEHDALKTKDSAAITNVVKFIATR